MNTKDPISHLMDIDGITEIMVNDFDKIFIEQNGKLELTTYKFDSLESYESYLENFLTTRGHDLDKNYFFDGALAGVFRYNIVLPPMSHKAPTLTLRRFSIKKFDLQTLIDKKSITNKVALFLDRIVKSKMNIIVSGGTGSGKTTFLQALCSALPSHERIVSIGDTPEISIDTPNWVQILSVREDKNKPPISIKDCLINSLRMRPTRIIVGECRKDETFEMLQAMNTGHEGSMTTIHANSSADCLFRLENLLYSSGHDVDISHIRTQISETIDFIIQLDRAPNGGRHVRQITEITAARNNVVTRAVIFQRDTPSSELEPTGLVPQNREKIEAVTSKFPPNFFLKDSTKN